MATATGFTAARMKVIEDSCIVSGEVELDALILTRRDGTEINAGNVRGPQGIQGIQGIQGMQGVQGVPGVGPTGSILMFAGSAPPSGHLICDGSAVSRTTYADLFGVIGTTYGVGDNSTTFNLPNLNGRVAVGKDASQTEFDTLGENGGAKTHQLTSAEMPSHTHTQNAHTHTLTNATVAAASHEHNLSSLGWALIAAVARSTNQIIMRRKLVTSYNTTHAINNANLGNGASTYVASEAGGVELGGTTDDNTSTTTVSAQDATPTNQNTGGGGAHNNLQPYLVLNYIIKT